MEDLSRLTPAEKDYMLMDYNSMMDGIECYADTAIQYGFSVLFVTALPCAPFFSLVSNYFKSKLNLWKLITVSSTMFNFDFTPLLMLSAQCFLYNSSTSAPCLRVPKTSAHGCPSSSSCPSPVWSPTPHWCASPWTCWTTTPRSVALGESHRVQLLTYIAVHNNLSNTRTQLCSAISGCSLASSGR